MKKRLVLAVVSLLLVTAPARARQVSRADFVEDINILFLKGDYSGLIKKQEGDLASLRLGRKDKKEILYLTGLSYLKLNKFAKARELFRDILDMRGADFRQDSYIGIADTYFREKNFDKAIRAYESVLTAYPRSDRLSGVYYNLGICYEKKKDSGKANAYFRKVKDSYDTSFEADKAFLSSGGGSPDFYIIQLGAFSGIKNAKKLVKRLTRKKYDSYIQKVRKDGRVLYRVRGGKFSNKAYAKRLLRRLRKDGFPAKIIVE
jgi:tetratricopeptide (TPR) repeat protein